MSSVTCTITFGKVRRILLKSVLNLILNSILSLASNCEHFGTKRYHKTYTKRAVNIYNSMPNMKGMTHRDKTSHRLLSRRIGFLPWKVHAHKTRLALMYLPHHTQPIRRHTQKYRFCPNAINERRRPARSLGRCLLLLPSPHARHNATPKQPRPPPFSRV